MDSLRLLLWFFICADYKSFVEYLRIDACLCSRFLSSHSLFICSFQAASTCAVEMSHFSTVVMSIPYIFLSQVDRGLCTIICVKGYFLKWWHVFLPTIFQSSQSRSEFLSSLARFLTYLFATLPFVGLVDLNEAAAFMVCASVIIYYIVLIYK